MRTTLAAAALVALLAVPAVAQPAYGAGFPPGNYQRQCTNLRMEGQFLHGVCRGAHGGGESSINVQSCATDIFVDDSGALTCVGPGGVAPPGLQSRGYQTYDRSYQDRSHQDGSYQDRGYQDRSYDRQRSRASAVLFDRRGYRGDSIRVSGAEPALGGRVGSIQIDRRSGPWVVCSDPGFRGRCVTIGDSVSDTRSLGLRDGIASIRPAR